MEMVFGIAVAVVVVSVLVTVFVLFAMLFSWVMDMHDTQAAFMVWVVIAIGCIAIWALTQP